MVISLDILQIFLEQLSLPMPVPAAAVSMAFPVTLQGISNSARLEVLMSESGTGKAMETAAAGTGIGRLNGYILGERSTKSR
ncbi:hypothetical protein C0033_03720 [Clostridium sp. chh4-2]|uniref:hypothetical protein n=1 Tax=Clostridium sp. chh4-2 TaxID=2067550 RepID=UPI000CCEACD1|nr:hypothetical protein [Clostridium sp. chh4-2]PNV63207.1 hypothetical protein C0033_03720 [Clostridium sp. chh4-2]